MNFEYKGFSVVIENTTKIFIGNKEINSNMTLRYQIEAYIDWLLTFDLI